MKTTDELLEACPKGRQASGIHKISQSSAMLFVDEDVVYAQFDRTDHPHAYGWWKYPRSEFEIVFWSGP